MLLLLTLIPSLLATTPIVTWHGAGGSASECDSLISTIRDTLPEVHVHNVAVGDTPEMDKANTLFMRCTDQIDLVCKQLLADPLMADGYNAVGISQGGLLIRGLVQRCPLPVRNLITFGSPHQGVYGIPECTDATGSEALCELVRELLSAGAYTPWVQDLIATAQYWHDPLNQTSYSHGSHYLALVNNEQEEQEPLYRQRMLQLHNFVMLKWTEDDIVIPRESSHFEFYTPGQSEEVAGLEESQLYLEDWIGLRELQEAGNLTRFSVPGGHVHFDYNWVAENIVPFLMDL